MVKIYLILFFLYNLIFIIFNILFYLYIKYIPLRLTTINFIIIYNNINIDNTAMDLLKK